MSSKAWLAARWFAKLRYDAQRNTVENTAVDEKIQESKAVEGDDHDPSITDNPAMGKGSLHFNSNTKELWALYDDTENKNKWIGIHTREVIQPNTPPTNPTNAGSFPSSANLGDVVSFTFSGATDATGNVTHYVVDNISSPYFVASNNEVAAGSATVFTVSTSLPSDTSVTFRVRAKDQYGSYSSGVTVTIYLYAVTYTVATGGSVTTSGDYKIHTFTGSSTFSVSSVGTDSSIEYLVVAGGGGGGGNSGGNGGGGGGGAGGYRSGSLTLSTGNHAISIGGGGSGGNDHGSNGSGSSALGISCVGGGRGGGSYGGGSSGGSGGGGAFRASPGAGTSGQGHSGHRGTPDSPWEGGGGGGANGPGYSWYYGGAGKASSITGSSVTRAKGGDTRKSPPIHGPSNTGNGGSGSRNESHANGGNGGSGVVILRYRYR